MNGYIYSKQQSLFQDRKSLSSNIIGYQKNNFMVKFINHKQANDFIEKNHYSKTSLNNTIDHFGIYIDNNLIGVLQFGYMLNPASCSKFIPLTNGIEDYRELNRMFLYDDAPRNSESKAISYCIKVLKKKYNIKWIQSFADERCHKLGIVYQAANFDFFGFHLSEFYTYKNEVYHKIRLTHKTHLLEKKYNEKIETIKKGSRKEVLRQFRYIYFIDKSWRNKCTLKKYPYPKHYLEKKFEETENNNERNDSNDS